MNLYELTATQLSHKLQSGECTAVEATQSVYSRIDEVENRVDAFLTLTKDAALQKARDVDEKRAKGEPLSPLAGVPIAIKDNICTKNVPTTCASKILGNFIPPYNATVVERLNALDAVMIGKLNLDEFAMGSSCENSYYKKTKNPHDLARVPGGSSGGSAASVAAGEAFLSLGSDTGGSIRMPASYCGIVGLKPTYGSVSRYGLVAFASSLDQIGPFGRSVADVALMYGAICGHDAKDATTVVHIYPNFTSISMANPKGLVIGIPAEYFSDGVDDEVKEKVTAAVRLLEQAGATVKPISLPSTDHALSAYYIISSAEASSNLARFDGVKYGYRAEQFDGLIDMYEKTRSEGFGDEVKRRIMLGTFVLSSGYYDAYYKKAKLFQKKITQEFEDAFTTCDVIITPTAPDTAFRLGEKSSDPVKMYASDICTVTVNIAGLPAISVPCGKDSKGLPVGMQIIGPRFSEQALFEVASLVEEMHGGAANVVCAAR